MKSPCGFAARLLGIGCLVFRCVTASAVVFTNDTSIAPTDLSYEGQDVVLSNCTVVVDGAHPFSNLLVAAGGTLTHTANLFFTSTNLQDFGSLPVVLTGTDVVALPYQDIVAASIGVTNTDLTLGYTNEVDYLIIDLGNGQTGLQRTPDSAIPDGATVLASFTAAVSVAMPSGLNLAVSGDVQVLAGGEINVTGKGHDGSTGSGHGASLGSPACGSGAGHGGLGGSGSSNAVGGTCYGVFYQPGTYGSGGGLGVGGPGGAGGGSVRLVVGGHAEIDGRILANGQDASNSRSGGGAGGSIWISAQTLNGTGVITANGGAGEPSLGGGGGGGRIAISFASNSFSGPITAYGGVGWVKGGAGSVFTKTGSQNGLLSLNNGDQAGANTLVTVSDDSVDVLIHSNVVVQPSGTWTAHNVTVQSGAALSADACGLPAGIGSGAGTSYPVDVVNRPCGGGGYGGCGGYGGTLATNAPGGNGYGIVNNDAHLPGSGGGRYGSISIGGAGGGVIGLNLYGILLLEGRLSANGGSGAGIAGGGGSGGAIFIVATNLTGAGSIAANGGRGAGSLGGGGGGGRIHLVLGTNAFSGPVTAFGGAGAGIGGAGTIFLDSSTGRTPLLIVDNAGQAGTNTPIGAFTFVADVFIRSNAVVAATGPWSVRDLTIASNSAFSATASGPTTIFITASQITLDPTAAVIADGAGYRAAAGPGAGGNYGGGGHGGLGGSGNTNVNAFSGGAYDSATGPNLGGSGGGNAGNSAFTGGAGGGALRFTVSGDFVLEGLVSANGRDSAVGGGGAGGSVYLTAKRLLGSGVITADGGSCAGPVGGGGGGGRIAIAAGLDLFAGTVTAYGGDGFVRGGAGTIYWPFPLGSPSAKFNQLILDNGGRPGTNTPVTSLDTADLIVRHGAKGVVTSGSASFHKLLIGSNSSLTLSGSATALNVSSGLVEFGGTLKTEGLVGNGGIGAGGSAYFPSGIYYGGGGGHGGYGGAGGVANARGGNSYDLTFAPTAPGGVGGGSGSTYAPFGGLGGGVLHLFVSGGFTNNGQISADGKMGVGACAGGGAGGSLWLELGGLSGSGLISANGGPGILPGGGGGGGGRISVSCDSNSFSGPITAVGGSGVYYGGAGTVYLRTNKLPYAQLIVDNGGNAGTNTTFVAEASSDLTVSGGGMAVLPTGGSSLHRIQIKTNGVLLATSGGSGVTLNLSGGMTIDLGGSFALDGLGYASGTGPGAGWGNSVGVRGGGGHGGYGAGNPQPGYSGNAYDSIQNPASGGSGGGDGHPSGGGAPSGGAGGGVLRLQMTASGAVLTVNGRLTANGRNGGVDGGGGAGGSLCLNLETLTGSGIISANGGAGSATAGGGGGGRIAIQYQSNNFTGTLAASGGGGVVAGGAGTIYLKSPKTWVGRLLVDNGGMPGTNTPVSDSLSIPTAPFEFAIAGDAVVVPLTPLPALSNLTLNTGGRLTARASDPNLPLAVLGDVTIGSGSAITVDGKGLGQGAGWGRGASFSSQGAG
ncbi:MAG TPA: hypothetical protein VL527_07135, partial [Dongiaceae bacterium]|nr:hypothetical protein [Dongiaceae bacterium]